MSNIQTSVKNYTSEQLINKVKSLLKNASTVDTTAATVAAYDI